MWFPSFDPPKQTAAEMSVLHFQKSQEEKRRIMVGSDDKKKIKGVYIAAGVFYILLIGIWGVLELFLMPWMNANLSETMTELIKEVGLKIPFWFVPAFILWKRFDSSMYVRAKEMFSVRKEHLWYLLVIAGFTAFHIVTAFRTKGSLTINSDFTLLDILMSVVIGFCEEIVFRGFLLNAALREGKSDILPIAVNAVLFVLIHFPVWYRTGNLVTYLTSGSFLQVVILSVIFSVSFKKSKSLVVPAALHMYWDLLCFMF